MMKPVSSENAAPATVVGGSAGMPAVPGDGAVPEAARRLLQELMDDALLERSRDQTDGLLELARPVPCQNPAQGVTCWLTLAKGTEFKPAQRPPVDQILHWNSW